MKKKWERPALVVLHRGRPEEVLATGCKSPSIPSSAMSANNKCDTVRTQGDQYFCRACQANNNPT